MVRTARATATVAGAFPQTFIILPSSNYNFCIYSFYAYLEFKFLSHLLRDSAVDGPLKDDAASAAPTLDPPDLLSALSLSQSNAFECSTLMSADGDGRTVLATHQPCNLHQIRIEGLLAP